MAQRTVEEWANSLDEKGFPMLRESLRQIRLLADDAESISAEQLARVILHDPLLTIRVLRMVTQRAGRKSSLRGEVTTVESAIILIGITPLLNTLLSTPVVLEDAADGKALGGLLKSISTAWHGAFQARDCAILHADLMSEEVFIAAILHNIAEIVLWWVAPQEARRIRRLMQVFEMTPDEAQLHVLGFRLTELRSSLMAFWQIPEALSVLMEASHAEWPRVKFILLSTSIAGHAANGWNSPALAADIEALSAIMKMTPDNTATLVHVNAAIAGRACAWFGVAPAAAWLPMLPEGGVPEPSEDDDLASFDPIEAHVSEMLLLVPQPAILKKVMDEIGRHLDGTLKFQQLMALSLKGMHEGIGLERVVFALLAQDHGTVKAKFILGASANSPLKNFRFSLTDNCLFAKLMSKTQSVWLHSGNRPNLEKLVSSSMQQITGGEDFFAMSIFVHDKPVGLFYADKQGGAEKLTDPAYQDFKQLCLRTAQGLAHLRV